MNNPPFLTPARSHSPSSSPPSEPSPRTHPLLEGNPSSTFTLPQRRPGEPVLAPIALAFYDLNPEMSSSDSTPRPQRGSTPEHEVNIMPAQPENANIASMSTSAAASTSASRPVPDRALPALPPSRRAPPSLSPIATGTSTNTAPDPASAGTASNNNSSQYASNPSITNPPQLSPPPPSLPRSPPPTAQGSGRPGLSRHNTSTVNRRSYSPHGEGYANLVFVDYSNVPGNPGSLALSTLR